MSQVRIIRGNGYEHRTCSLLHTEKGKAFLVWPSTPPLVMPFWLNRYARSVGEQMPPEPKSDPRQTALFHAADLAPRQAPPPHVSGHDAGQGCDEFHEWAIHPDDLADLKRQGAA